MEKSTNKTILLSFLIISGEGRNTGKTTLACRILQQFSQKNRITAIKISSHFHEPTPNLTLLYKTKGFSISLENNRNTDKDSSRMLQSGAEKSFYIQAEKGMLKPAFEKYMKDFHTNDVTICESGALTEFLRPGVRLHILNAKNKGGILLPENKAGSEIVLLKFNGKDFTPSIKSLCLSGKNWQWK